MTSNIGNDVNVLWKHYDRSVTEDFLVHRQQMHVSILSICSFVGRLFSGESRRQGCQAFSIYQYFSTHSEPMCGLNCLPKVASFLNASFNLALYNL